jgi:ABC-type molybdate transport system substrate-binding protein
MHRFFALLMVLGVVALAMPVGAASLVALPADHDADVRWFGADGEHVQGLAAFERMPKADLTLWLAGNQFFAMDRVVGDFQNAHRGLSIGLITLPPGLLLEAIKAGGWTYEGHSLPLRPDVYGTVVLDHLRATGLIDTYVLYMHNALQLMVAPGNPKQIRDLRDLARPDLRVTLPNPVNEGIMTGYAKPVLQQLKLWDELSGGKECAGCDPTPRVHFSVVHHREIPERIAAGQTDVGIVWQTETKAALARGAKVAGVALPPEQSAIDSVSYFAGILRGSPHRQAAQAYLEFITSPAGQAAYGEFGFLPATEAERRTDRLN